jgi:ubiquilin
MGAPPSEEDVASMLENPNTAQMMREALSNPAMVDMIIQNTPQFRNNPQARQIIQSPEFQQMMTNPNAIREAARMRRMFGGGGGPAAFPAPGITDSTPASAAGSNPAQSTTPAFNPFAAMGPGVLGGEAGAGANPFAALFGGQPPGATPSQTPPAPGSAGQGTPGQGTPGTDANAANPFASLFGGSPGAGAANPFGGMQLPPMTPQQMQEAMQFLRNSGMGPNLFGDAGAGSSASPQPADTRPPEEIYADQLRQLNDMGFTDFDRNVAALRRSGGSVQGAIEQLLM